MPRFVLFIALFANLTIFTVDAMAGGSVLETFFGRNHTSDEINRRGRGQQIRIDSSSMNMSVKTNATINKGLRAIGLPAFMGPPQVQRQSKWVKGHGFVDITEQAQRQVDADFRRANGQAVRRQANTQRSSTASRTTKRPTSPIQTTVELLRSGDSMNWMTDVNFDSIQQRALQSLMVDPARFESADFRLQEAAISQELTIIDHAAIIDELLLGVERPSLTFVGGAEIKNGGTGSPRHRSQTTRSVTDRHFDQANQSR